MSNIFCIWYPAGGFGHFINGVLTLHGENFARSKDKNIEFDTVGTSHDFALVAPKYFNDPDHYHCEFDNSLRYPVLIDNGIENETKTFKRFFDHAQIIKICYSDWAWPVLARTMIEKAMKADFDAEVAVDQDLWPEQQAWAQREKYFLFLRDHHYRPQWKPDPECHNLLIDDMLDYHQLKTTLQTFGITLTSFENLWQDWSTHNHAYTEPVVTAKQIVQAIQQHRHLDLAHCTNIWTQAVTYYYIWLIYEFEVPHNDHKDWFTNTKDIVTMLDKHGVSIDSNQKSFC